jgi:hypothetical protein
LSAASRLSENSLQPGYVEEVVEAMAVC